LYMIMMTQQAWLRCVDAEAVKHDPRQAQGAPQPTLRGMLALYMPSDLGTAHTPSTTAAAPRCPKDAPYDLGPRGSSKLFECTRSRDLLHH
jgi:hypothetical protein